MQHLGSISQLWYKNTYDTKRYNRTLNKEQTNMTIIKICNIEDKLTKFYLAFLLGKC